METGGDRACFTSTLSVSEFALMREAGVQPLHQVLGTCVTWSHALDRRGYGSPGEFSVMRSRRWTVGLGSALARLSSAAAEYGADAVLAVRLDIHQDRFGTGDVEFVASGTAVRARQRSERRAPVLCNLSVQDYWKLTRAGYAVEGIVAATSLVTCVPTLKTIREQQQGRFAPTGRMNRERFEFTEAELAAYRDAMVQVRAQASNHGAEDVIAIQFRRRHHFAEHEASYRAPAHRDLNVLATAIGTAIRYTGHTSPLDERALLIRPIRNLSSWHPGADLTARHRPSGEGSLQ